MIRIVGVIAAGLALLVTSPAGAGSAKLIMFEARDGFELAANHFDPGKPGPGILLLHQCNSDKSMWDGIGTRLADAGYHVLAMDYRGYADSTKPGGLSIVGASRDARQRLHLLADADVLAGYRKLISIGGVDASRIGTGGASCGGPRSIKVARAIEGLQTMLFLSTFVDDELITSDGAAARVPVLVITAESDGLTTSSVRRLFETSKNPASRLVLYKGDAHGRPLFLQDSRLETTIVDWYRDHLR